LHPDQPSGLQGAQERGPEGAVLAVADVQAQHLPAAIGGDPGGDDDRTADDPAIDSGLEVGGVHEQVREDGVRQRAGPEHRDVGVQLGADPADLGLGDAGVHAQRPDQVIDLAGGGAMDIGLHDHPEQGSVDAPARLQQRGEERAFPELGNVQLDIASLGGQQPRAGTVAVRCATR
jgi:hypothetical protein